MKRYDFDWGYVGIEQREDEYGDWVRYEDALAHYSQELDHAYAKGRTDESKEMAGPLALMRDAFDLLESHLGDSEVEYEDDEEEREYAPVQVAARYLMAAIQAMQGGRK